jgi:DNA-binding beta-propeller fold protein YncE
MVLCRKLLRIAVLAITAAANLTITPAYAFEAFITNERSGDVISVDQQGKLIHVQPVCNRPRGMVKGMKRHQLLIACSDDHKVIELNTQTRTVERSFDGLHGAMTLAIHHPTNRLFVTNEGKAQATVLDLTTGNTLAILPTGLEPDGIAVTDNGKQIFVASENAGLVHVFDAISYRQTAVIVTHLRPRRLALLGNKLWVSSEMGSRVEIFSIDTLEKVDEVIFAPKGFRSEQMTPVDILFDNTGTLAFVALGSANHVAFVNIKSLEIEKYILVGRRAWGLGISPDNRSLIVLNGLSDDFTIIDIDSRRPRVTGQAGLIPHAIQVF